MPTVVCLVGAAEVVLAVCLDQVVVPMAADLPDAAVVPMAAVLPDVAVVPTEAEMDDEVSAGSTVLMVCRSYYTMDISGISPNQRANDQ